MRRVLLLVSTLLCLFGSSSAAIISSVYPRTSGLMGGQQITLTGVGFLRGGNEGQTNVYIKNQPCTFIESLSTDTQYVCVVPPSDKQLEGCGAIRMQLVGTAFNYDAQCAISGGSGCQLCYYQSLTGKVNSFVSAAAPTGLITFNANAPEGYTLAQIETRVGSEFCNTDLSNYYPWIPTAFLTVPNADAINTYNDYKCSLNAQTAKRTNFTFRTLPNNQPEDGVNTDRNGIGYAAFPHTAYQVNIEHDEVFNFETLPVVTGLWPTTSGKQGGSKMYISGAGFDGQNCANNKVYVAGQSCEVVNCDPSGTYLECIVPAAPANYDSVSSTDLFPAGRGLKTEVWYYQGWSSLSNVFNNIQTNNIAPDFTMQSLSGLQSFPAINSQYYYERLSGLFVPPYTANYTFMIQGQNRGELFLSTDSSAANGKLIASFDGNGLYYTATRQISKQIYLHAGKPYYIQLRHSHYNGYSMHANVMLKMDPKSVSPETPLPVGYPSRNVQRYNSLPTVMQVAIRTDVKREIQQLKFEGINAGTFKLKYGTYLSTLIDLATMTPASFRDALANVLYSARVCYDISVSFPVYKLDTNGTASINVQFNCPGAVPRALVSIINIALVADGVNDFATSTVRLQSPSQPASGYFYLGWTSARGVQLNDPASGTFDYSARINYDANWSNMKQALLRINGIAAVDVSNGGNTLDGQTFTITVYEQNGDIPLFQPIWNNTLLGDGIRVEVAYLQRGDGANHYWPTLPSSMLFAPANKNRVEVVVGEFKSVCGAGIVSGSSYMLQAGDATTDCALSYDDSITPQLNEVSTTDISVGSSLTLTVANINPDPSSNTVVLKRGSPIAHNSEIHSLIASGRSVCPIVEIPDANTFVVNIPELPAGDYYIYLLTPNGLAVVNPALPVLKYASRLDNVYPVQGSVQGGNIIVAYGSGFNEDTTILVGGQACPAVRVTSNLYYCRVPASPVTDADSTFTITVNGVEWNTPYTYSLASTPQLISVTPQQLSAAVTNVITIVGSGFNPQDGAIPGNDDPSWVDSERIFSQYVIKVGGRFCEEIAPGADDSGNQILTCRLPRAAPTGRRDVSSIPQVYIVGVGYAAPPMDFGPVTVSVGLTVSYLSTRYGSLAGGSEITISGSGFKPNRRYINDHSLTVDPEYISVKIVISDDKQIACHIKEYEFGSIVCTTDSTHLDPAAGQSLIGLVVVSVNNIKSTCSSESDDPLQSECYFTFSPDYTAVLQSISPSSAPTGTTVTINGMGLDAATATVYLGHQVCLVWSQTWDQILCNVPSFTISTMPVYVSLEGRGFAATKPVSLPPFTVVNYFEPYQVVEQVNVTVTHSRQEVDEENLPDGVSFNSDDNQYYKTTPASFDTKTATTPNMASDNTVDAAAGGLEIVGTDAAHDETLTGTEFADSITANSGDRKTIQAAAGNDLITLGTGHDIVVNADDGDDDVLMGTGDRPIINAGAGNDYVKTGSGHDATINGGAGSDFVEVVNANFDRYIVDLGDDDDVIVFNNVGIQRDHKLAGGAGTDTLRLNTASTNFRVVASSVDGYERLESTTSNPTSTWANGEVRIDFKEFEFIVFTDQTWTRGDSEWDVLSSTTAQPVDVATLPKKIVIVSEPETRVVNVTQYAAVQVYVLADDGLSAPVDPLLFTFELALTELNIKQGSLGGGLLVTLSGAGFSPVIAHNEVKLGGHVAIVRSATPDYLEFFTPASSVAGLASLSVNVNSYYALDSFYDDDIVLDNIATGIYPLKASVTKDLADAFEYLASLSATVTNITPLVGPAGTSITITGTGFSNPSVNIAAVDCAITSSTETEIVCTVGNVPAGSHSVNVLNPDSGLAVASPSPYLFDMVISVSEISPLKGGFGGGVLVTIAGAGFSDKLEENTVNICNAKCLVQTASFNELTCITSPLVTIDRLRRFGPTLIQTATPSRVYHATSTSIDYSPLFDENVETGYTGSGGCAVRFDMGNKTNLVLTRVRYFPTLQSASSWPGVTITGSQDGKVWTTIATLSKAYEGWNFQDIIDTNTINPDVQVSYRYFGINSYSSCKLQEVELQGYNVAWFAPATEMFHFVDPVRDVAECPFEISVNSAPVQVAVDKASKVFTASSKFEYKLSLTPTVSWLSQSWGSALGGDSLALVGTGFQSDSSLNVVTLNDYPCAVTYVAGDSQLGCTTSPRLSIRPAPSGREISVLVNAPIDSDQPIGYAILTVDLSKNTSPLRNQGMVPTFRYLDLWSALSTWKYQEPPVDGDTVQVPQGQAVLLDVPTPKLFLLLVQGVLVFDQTAGQLSIDTHYFYVQGGRVEIGTETAPFTQRATITLRGDRETDIELPIYGAKGLFVSSIGYSMVDGVGAVPINPLAQYQNGVDPSTLQAYSSDSFDGRGHLDIHGRPIATTVAKSSISARANDYLVTIDAEYDLAGWNVGDEIAITSTTAWNQTEKRTIEQIDGQTLYFYQKPLKFDHISERYTVDGRDVDMRFEVALLSRNILIQGDENSLKQLYGGHLYIARGSVARIEFTEFKYMGQAHNQDRFPLGFIQMGEAHESYSKSNSFHESFQRAVGIRSSSYVTVSGNTAAYVRGHAFYIADGSEKLNVFDSNFAAQITPLNSMMKSDQKPSCFYTASPSNIWRNNIAAGSLNDGFWFELPGNSLGSSFSTRVCPVHGALIEFNNNIAHSNGKSGLRVFPTYTPYVDPCNSGSGVAPQYFRNFFSYHNGANGVFVWNGGDLRFDSAVLVENVGTELSWTRLPTIGFRQDASFITNSLFMATPDSSVRPYPAVKQDGVDADGNPVFVVIPITTPKYALHTPQNEYFQVSDLTFYNYNEQGAIASCNLCVADGKQGGYTIRTKGLRFENSHKKLVHTQPFKEIFYDLDGSLTGYVNGSTTYYRAFNDWAECYHDQDGQFDHGLVCDGTVRIRRMQFDGVAPYQFDYQYMVLTQRSGLGELSAPIADRPLGEQAVSFYNRELWGWVVPMVTRHFYALTFLTKMDWTSMRIRYSEPAYVKTYAINNDPESNEFLGFQFNYTNYRYNYMVISSDNRLRPWKTEEITASDDTGVSTMGNLIGQNGTFSMIMSAKNTSLWTKTDPLVLKLTSLQCPLTGCPLPPVVTPVNGGGAGSNTTGNRWSDPNTWPDKKVPTLGQEVVISPYMNVLYDVGDSAHSSLASQFGSIRIEGRLTFEDTADRVLIANNIVVFGSLSVGSAAAPYRHKLNIVLNGERSAPSVIVTEEVVIGNKALAVYGQVQLFGAPRNFTSSRLVQTLTAGSNTLVLADAVDWAVGEQIAVSSTEYDASQTEVFTIQSVNGNIITVSAAAVHSHFSGVIDGVSLQSVVGVLNRNVRIGSQGKDSTYGGHVIVSEIPAQMPSGSQTYVQGWYGSFRASFVEFAGLGQQSMEAAAVDFVFGTSAGSLFQIDNQATAGSISDCAFNGGLNYGINAVATQNLQLQRNFFYRSFRNTIQLDSGSSNAVIVGNVITLTRRSPDDTGINVVPFASVWLESSVSQFSDNVIAGSEDVGVVFYPESCSVASSALRIFNNEVAAAKVGFWLLSDKQSGCVQVNSVKAWKIAHIAVLTVDQSNNVIVDSAIISDSHIGVSLNFLRSSVDSFGQIVRSTIFGSTAASSCDDSLTCLAASGSDLFGSSCQSVFGPTTRRIGVMTSQYTNKGKLCASTGNCRPLISPERLCSMPFEKRYGLPNDAAYGVLRISSTRFGYFSESDCGLRSKAVAWNPSSRDFVPPVFVDTLSWTQVEANAKFDFAYREGISDPSCKTRCEVIGSDSTGSGSSECGETSGDCINSGGDGTVARLSCKPACDGLRELTLIDEDGSALQQPLAPLSKSHTLLSQNVLLAQPGSACSESTEWGSFVCPDSTYRRLIVENLDSDRTTRQPGPLLLTRAYQSENRTDYTRGPIDDGCANKFFFGQYVANIIPQSTYDVKWSGSNPSVTRFHFRSSDPNEVVLLRIRYNQPYALDVMKGGVLVSNNNEIVPTMISASGASSFSAQTKTLTLVLRGSANPADRVFDVIAKPVIQLTLSLAVTVEQFYGPKLVQNLALLLKIDPSRIKIVSVQAGSVNVEIQIQPEISPVITSSANSTSTTNSTDSGSSSSASTTISYDASAAVVALQTLSAKIATLATDGSMTSAAVGYSVAQIKVAPPAPVVSNSSTPADNPIVVANPTPNPVIAQSSTGLSQTNVATSTATSVAPAPSSTGANSGVVVGGGGAGTIVTGSSSSSSFPSWAIAVVVAVGAAFLVIMIVVFIMRARSQSMQSNVAATTAPVGVALKKEDPALVFTPVKSPKSVEMTAMSDKAARYKVEIDTASAPQLPVEDLDEIPTVALVAQRTSSASTTALNSPSHIAEGATRTVAKAHTPRCSDELDLAVGDQVVILDAASDSNFLIGLNTRTNKRGAFPRAILAKDSAFVNPARPTSASVAAAAALTPEINRENSTSSSANRRVMFHIGSDAAFDHSPRIDSHRESYAAAISALRIDGVNPSAPPSQPATVRSPSHIRNESHDSIVVAQESRDIVLPINPPAPSADLSPESTHPKAYRAIPGVAPTPQNAADKKKSFFN